jgi:uncharacterized membrane protein YoaK (UPF0700 family)
MSVGWTRALLVLAAGSVNAFGFLALGGVFTSVVTANSAALGLDLGGARFGAARPVALALLAYVVGAAAGSLTAGGRGRVPAAGFRGVLALEALLLWLVAACWSAWSTTPDAAQRGTLLFLAAAAMGCQNAGVRVVAGGDATTAYLTGLVTSTIAAFVTQGRAPLRNVTVVLLLVAGAAATGAVFRWVHHGTALLPALLVTAALARQDSAERRVRARQTAATGR